MTQPSDEMIERVARALAICAGDEPDQKASNGQAMWEFYTPEARAAIAATGLVEEYARQARELLSADGENHALLAENVRLKASGDAMAEKAKALAQCFALNGLHIAAIQGGREDQAEVVTKVRDTLAQWEKQGE